MFNLNQNGTHLSNYKLFEDFHFIEQFKNLVKNKPNFAKSVRSRPISSAISRVLNIILIYIVLILLKK